MMSPRTRFLPNQVADLPVLWEGDVVVAGGGSAGASAGIASARAGARTLIVESGAFLGGTGARVLDTFYGFYAPGAENARIVGGIGWEVCEQLTARGHAFERPNTYGAGTGVTYDPESLKVVWDELAAASGVDVLFYALVTGVIMTGDVVEGLVVETKSGPQVVRAAVTIDTTGEAEVAWRAGAAVQNDVPRDGLQPATATFRMGGVATKTATTKELHAEMKRAVSDGDFALPRVEGSIHVTTIDGVRHANMTRVSGRDLTDPWQLSQAEREGRQQVWEYANFLTARVDGYGNAHLLAVSPRLGIRETRRLAGEYVLDTEDFEGALRHDDDIALCGAPIEDHAAGEATRWEYVGGKSEPDGTTYGIPYGALVPERVDGLLVAGRCFSASHNAHASARSIGQCMAMGQAAGTAAAHAARENLQPRRIDRDRLREALVAADVIL